ncbi:MAG: diguanylate cyclase [Deltaproteobacteria bacterium]|nr:diguanylate cyclase [Deltaproteobacteria bacterium]
MRTVLLVDDSPAARRALSEHLEANEFVVTTAASAEDAFELALATPPDIVVTDLWMPGMSGVQLCRLLRAERSTSSIPILLLTASEDRRTRFWARCAGADAYVHKGKIHELIERIQQAVPRPEIAPTGMSQLRGGANERLAQLLDTALFESVIAGSLRALTQHDSESDLFRALATTASDVLEYRWLALVREGRGAMCIHANQAEPAILAEAKEALRCPDRTPSFLCDDRPHQGPPSQTQAVTHEIRLGDKLLGHLAMSPSRRSRPEDDRLFMEVAARELGAVLHTLSLVEDARRLAATDTLTGLMNRRAFVDSIRREISRCTRHSFSLSLLLLDVDHFKRVNDTHGHGAGDQVLVTVARALERSTRTSDIVARWGGEEFVVALIQSGEAGARIAAERIRRAIATAPTQADGGVVIDISASIGVASVDGLDKGCDLDDLVRRADEAMYTAKQRGRNRVEIAPALRPAT